jgi:hypothetical protein
LNGHFAATLDSVDLLAEWIQARALAGVGKQLQFITAATGCNSLLKSVAFVLVSR